jgi:hypothetical protein
MASVAEISAEMHFLAAGFYEAWAWARVAACPWWKVVRRAALVRQARAHARESAYWFEKLNGPWPREGARG